MSDEDTKEEGAQRIHFWKTSAVTLIEFALIIAASILLRFILTHFLWFQSLEERHAFWAQLVPVWVVVLPCLYLFRRKQRLAETQAYREDLRLGRMRRMSLASRCAVILMALGLVVTGSLIRGPDGTLCLLLGVPVFFLFAGAELAMILRPGNSVLGDPHDELLNFFKARTLQAGYTTAMLSISILYLVSLFTTKYVGVLLPVVLSISLLAPAFVYRRLDRQAGVDE
jgi:hypothetical protein